jgi:hypothetical protein
MLVAVLTFILRKGATAERALLHGAGITYTLPAPAVISSAPASMVYMHRTTERVAAHAAFALCSVNAAHTQYSTALVYLLLL